MAAPTGDALNRARVLEAAVQIGSLGGSRPYQVAGEALNAVQLVRVVDTLSASGAVWIGEHREAADDHELQAGIVAAVAIAKTQGDGKVAVGLEAVRSQYQPALDAFISGEIGDLEELRKFTAWDKHWPYSIDRYASTLELCRSLSLEVVALGAGAEELERVERSGFADLDEAAWGRVGLPEGAAGLAAFGSTPQFQTYTEAVLRPSFVRYDGASRSVDYPFFERHVANSDDFAPGRSQHVDQSYANFYCASMLWDEVIASTAARYLNANEGSTLVALVGTNRVSYGQGAAARCALKINGPTNTLILNPSPKTDSLDPCSGLKLQLDVKPVNAASTTATLPLANYLWFSPWSGDFL